MVKVNEKHLKEGEQETIPDENVDWEPVFDLPEGISKSIALNINGRQLSVNNRYAGVHQKLKIHEHEFDKSIAGRG